MHVDNLKRHSGERDKQQPGLSRLADAPDARRIFMKEMAQLRKAQGKSQTQVAAAMKTSAAVVSRLEAGGDVQLSTLEKYLAALGHRLELTAVGLRKPKSPRPLSEALRTRPVSRR